MSRVDPTVWTNLRPTLYKLCCRKEAARCFVSVSSLLQQYKTSSRVYSFIVSYVGYRFITACSYPQSMNHRTERLARHRLPVTFRCGQRAAARVPTWQKRRVRPALNGPAPACHQRPSTLFTQLGQHYFLYTVLLWYYSTSIFTRYGYQRVTLRWQLRSNHYWRWPSPI